MLLKAILPQSVIRVQVDLGLPVGEIEVPDIPDPPEPLDPQIVLSGSLAPFATEEGTPSEAQNYGVKGIDLSEGIRVEAPEGFEISTDALSWDDELLLAPDYDGLLWVRLTGEAAGEFGGYIGHYSEGAQSWGKAVLGEVAEQEPEEPEVSITAWDGEGNEIPAVAVGDYDYWVFTDDGRLVVEGEPEVDVLLVGGGGIGASATGSFGCGGGGAGGFLLERGLTLDEAEYEFEIAQTMTEGVQAGYTAMSVPVAGGDAIEILKAWGGGAGGRHIPGAGNQSYRDGKPGASGGGGSGTSESFPGAAGQALTLDPMQGSNGGAGAQSGSNRRGAGGGGGIAAPGSNGADLVGGKGGAGYSLDSAQVFDSVGLTAELIDKLALPAGFNGVCGGGGGGAHNNPGTATHGGGAGSAGANATDAKPNSGGGGGGARGGEGGAGGSGIVIVRHLRVS